MDLKNSTIEEMNFNLINSTISVKETFVDLIQQNKISLYRLSKITQIGTTVGLENIELLWNQKIKISTK